MTIYVLSNQCSVCQRLIDGPGIVKGRWGCEAFVKGIPKEIAIGNHDHSKPLEGDGGKQFVLIEGKSIEYQGSP